MSWIGSQGNDFWNKVNELYPFKPDDFYYTKRLVGKSGRENIIFTHKRFEKVIPKKCIPVDLLPKIKPYHEPDTSTSNVPVELVDIDPSLAKLVKKRKYDEEIKKVHDLVGMDQQKKHDLFWAGLIGATEQAKKSKQTKTNESTDIDLLKEYGISNKSEYLEWAKKNHPDKGGNPNTFRLIHQTAKKKFSL